MPPDRGSRNPCADEQAINAFLERIAE